MFAFYRRLNDTYSISLSCHSVSSYPAVTLKHNYHDAPVAKQSGFILMHVRRSFHLFMANVDLDMLDKVVFFYLINVKLFSSLFWIVKLLGYAE